MNKSLYISNSLYYMFTPLLRNSLAFLTLPIMTRYLLPKDYGVLSLIAMVTSICTIFYLGLVSSTVRYYFKYEDDHTKLQQLIMSNILYIFLSSILLLVALTALFPLLNAFLFENKLELIWINLSFIQCAIAYVNMINQYLIQNQHQGRKWFFTELYAIIVQISISMVLVVTKIFTFEAVIIAGLVAEIVRGAVALYHVRKYYTLVFNYSFFKESLQYAWPQVPSSLLGYVYLYLDRFLLSKFQGLAEVGILAMSSNFSNILKMSQDGIAGALRPVTLGLLTENTKESKEKLANINLKIIFILLLFALFIILFIKEAVILLTTKDYYYVIYVVPLYIYYYVFSILGVVSYWWLYFDQKNTYLQIPFSIATFIISSIANIALIPKYGVMGAAIATFLSSMCVQTVSFIVGLKLTTLPINVGKVALMFMTTIAMTGLLYLLYYLQLHFIIEIFIKLLMIGFFVFICYFMKIFMIDEIKEIILGAKQKTLRYLYKTT